MAEYGEDFSDFSEDLDPKPNVHRSVGAHIYEMNAKHRNEMRQLESRHHRALQQLNKNREKMDAYSKEVHRLRDLLNKSNREEKTTTKKLVHLAHEKKQLEVEAKSNRAYAKKIEQKLAMGMKGQALVDKNQELRGRLRDMQGTVEERENVITSQHQELEKAAAEIIVLTRALEVRADELGHPGQPGNVRSSVLYQTAKRKQENHALQLDLAEKSDLIKQLEEVLQRSQDELQAQQAGRQDLQQQLLNAERSLLDERQECDSYKAELEELKKERVVMLEYIQELAEKCAKLEREIEVSAVNSDAALQDVHQQLSMAREREQALTTARDSAASRVEKLLEMQKATEQVLAAEREKVEHQRGEVDSNSKTLTELRANNQSLQQQVDQLTSVNLEVQAQYSELQQHSAAALSSQEAWQGKTSKLEGRVSELEQGEDKMRSELEGVLQDLERVTGQREEAVKAMNEAVAISAQSLVEQQGLEAKAAEQKSQIGLLQQSKTLLQKAMLEQLQTTRQQLKIEQDRRQTTETENLRLRAQTEKRFRDSIASKYGLPGQASSSPAKGQSTTGDQSVTDIVAQHLMQVEQAQGVSSLAPRMAHSLNRPIDGTAPSLMDLAAQ